MAKNKFKIIRVYVSGKPLKPTEGQGLLEYRLLLALVDILGISALLH